MLEASALTVDYGKHRGLDAVHLKLRPAELGVMLGANGAGKSTLLRALGGMLRAVPGARIMLDGTDLLALPAHQLVDAGVALVPEGRGLFDELTVRENLRLGALPRRAWANEGRNLERVLALFPRLSERLRQAVGTMSGGEQQMVALARALMSEPRFLLLDEPTLGPSPLMAQELFAAVRQVKTLGVGILLAERNAHASLAIADRGYLLATGRIVGNGQAQALRDDTAVQRAYLGGASVEEQEHWPAAAQKHSCRLPFLCIKHILCVQLRNSQRDPHHETSQLPPCRPRGLRCRRRRRRGRSLELARERALAAGLHRLRRLD